MLFKDRTWKLTVFPSSVVFILSLALYYYLYHIVVQPCEYDPILVWVTTGVRALVIAVGFAVIHLTLTWLKHRPDHHVRAVRYALIILFLLILLQFYHYVEVARSINAAWLPDHAIEYARRPILMRACVVLIAFLIGLVLRKKKPMYVIIVAAVAIGYFIMFPEVYAIYVSLTPVNLNNGEVLIPLQ